MTTAPAPTGTPRPEDQPPSMPSPAGPSMGHSPSLRDHIRRLDSRWFGRRGWARILRNMAVGFIVQAGTRMAAALSYYALLAAGPLLILTFALGGLVLGDDATSEIAASALQRLLPPSADLPAEVAGQLVQSSRPTAGLALVTGLVSLIGFTRALASSLNAMLNVYGAEPIRRTAWMVPLLYLAVLGLIWGSWMFEVLARLAQSSAEQAHLPYLSLILGNIAPLLLAVAHFAIILTIVPRAKLSFVEIAVTAVLGALLWEAARQIFGWLVGTDSYYLRLFGPLGGIVALLGWIYVSSVILILAGQFAWAFAMERRGRGHLARRSPRAAGLERLAGPLEKDNAVNESHQQ